MEPTGYPTVPMEIDLKPLVFGPGFSNKHVDAQSGGLNAEPKQDFRAGDDGNRAGGVHGFVEGVSSENDEKTRMVSFEEIMDIT